MTSTSVATVQIKGAYFIDRDGDLFGSVLDVLRGNFDYEWNEEQLKDIQIELDFYAVQTDITEPFAQLQVAKREQKVQDINVVLENLEGRWSMVPEIRVAHGRVVFAVEIGAQMHFLFNVQGTWCFPGKFEFGKMLHDRETFYEFVDFCAKYTSKKIMWETVGSVRLFYISH